MSEVFFDYHAILSGASFKVGDLPYPLLHADPPFKIPQGVSAILSEEGCALAAELVRMALEEDGPDLTSLGIFPAGEQASAHIVAKQETLVIGLPLIDLVLSVAGMPPGCWTAEAEEGSVVPSGTIVARLSGHTMQLLKVERIILNLMTHLSGVGNLTRQYLHELEGTGVRLLDTRKTLPGFRHLEKYAVRVAGGVNHRMNLWEMLMVKDNHIDAAGSITRAVASLREHFHPCPPIEVECRGVAEVREAVACRPARILLDNMGCAELRDALPLIPAGIEAEISGGVSLGNIRELALACTERPADFISVGRLTHSAPSADFSMRMERRP
ncbi:MAG: carboxylating nicotinate-nucleotide diphosphorylase [Desulfovibrio sp.]|jgi:nicotinate-nucleotide pyrophosphorylase (carboxylating)